MIYPVDYYRLDDGKTHVFTSDHADLIGMCAMAPDVRLAYTDVAVQISILLLHNFGRSETYVPLRSLESIMLCV